MYSKKSTITNETSVGFMQKIQTERQWRFDIGKTTDGRTEKRTTKSRHDTNDDDDDDRRRDYYYY